MSTAPAALTVPALRALWLGLGSTAATPPAIAELYHTWWLAHIEPRHSEPQRAYHTLQHLGEIAGWVDHVMHDLNAINRGADAVDAPSADGTKGGPSELALLRHDAASLFRQTDGGRASLIPGASEELRRTLLWTTFFHDIVYDPTASAGANEENSALLWLQFCDDVARTAAPPSSDSAGSDGTAEVAEARETVAAIIRQTAQHMKCPNTPETPCATKLFLDMDLAVLGANPQRYSEYAADIRKEYGHFPDEKYTAGRASVMASFTDIPRLYFTEYFHARLEQQARDNIAAEIAALEATVNGNKA